MEYEFSIIKPFYKAEEIKKNKKKYSVIEQLHTIYLLKCMPINMKDIIYLETLGREIILPFTYEELQNLKESYIEKLWDVIKKKYNIAEPFWLVGFPNKINKIFVQEIDFGNIINYIMFPQIMKKILKENNIPLKEVKLAILDSNNRKIEFILEVLYKELNFLKIITERQEYFEEFKEMIYHVTGLIAETMSPSEHDCSDANVIIDMNCKREYNYRRFRENAIVIDMESSLEKRQYFAVKRKDFVVLYDYEFLYQGERIQKNIAEMILYRKYSFIRDFLNNKRKDYLTDELIQIGNEFSLGKLKYLKG